MERIGIYGGAFNPPHLGHIRAAEYALGALRLDKLLVIPSCQSPHKGQPVDSATEEQRLQMLKIAFRDMPSVCVSDLELRRGGISYTYETVSQVAEQYPEAELILFMGTDMFLSFQNWKNTHMITRQAALAVFYRGEKNEIEAVTEQKTRLEKEGVRVYLVENAVTQISSTDLRRMLIFDCAEEYLSPGVQTYIRGEGLYGTGRNLQSLSTEALESVVAGLLKPDRVNHVLGCKDTAVALARRWNVNETDAARAGLLHDITKALDGPKQLTLCRAYGIILDNFSKENPKTLHALTGSLVAHKIFGENPNVVSAIRSHTTGKADMNMLEKIIYVADYMEPNRSFPGVEQLRDLAFTDIDGALKLGLEMTLQMLHQQGREISGASLEALAWLEK